MDKVWNVKLAQRVLSFLLVVFILVIAVYKGPELLEAIKKVRLLQNKAMCWNFAWQELKMIASFGMIANCKR